MIKYLAISSSQMLPVLLLIGAAWGQTFKVELLNERNYPWRMKENGTYVVKVGEAQTIFKIKATTSSPHTEKIAWKTKKEY